MSDRRGRSIAAQLALSFAIAVGAMAGAGAVAPVRAANPAPVPAPSHQIASGPGGFERLTGHAATKASPPAVHGNAPSVTYHNAVRAYPSSGSAGAPTRSARAQIGPVPAPTLVSHWPGTSLNSQVAAYPPISPATVSDQAATPPDPNLAVGGNWVVEATNSAVTVFDRNGVRVANAPGATCPLPPSDFSPPPGQPAIDNTFTLGGCGSVDLYGFVGAPTGWNVSDPRILYDQASGVWYLSLFAWTVPGVNQTCDNISAHNGDTCSEVVLAHSQTGDPTGAWKGYFIPQYYLNTITDQPRIGYSADKIAITWGEDGPGAWLGDELIVLNKSQFLANQASLVIWPANGQEAPPETDYFSEFPVPETSSGNNSLYVVANNASTDLPVGGGAAPGPSLHVITVTGGSAGAVSFATNDPPINPSHAPPDALQQGDPALITTDDDRINNGVWNNGILFTGFNDTCATACIRYLKLPTAPIPANFTTGGAFEEEYNPGTLTSTAGQFVYYPSFGVDASGDLFSTMTESSSTMPPSVIAIGSPAGQPSWGVAEPIVTPVVTGAGPYVDSVGQRFGDYAGGAIDPQHPGDFWFANEVQLDGATHSDWGTEIGRITYALPSVSNLTPGAGPALGGTTVTVNGSDFLPSTSLNFAGGAVAISNLKPDSFTFTTPSHAPGPVTAVVSDVLGSSPATYPNGANGYIYLGLGVYRQLAPVRIVDTRGAYCAQCSGGAIGPNLTRTFQVTGYPNVAVGVPAAATSVVLNVTAVSGSQSTFLSVYPTGTGQPIASTINAPAGGNIANLVTVPLGTGGQVNIYNAAGSINVVADVEGYYIPDPIAPGVAGKYHPLASPLRICDSRGAQPVNGCNSATQPSDHPLGPGGIEAVRVGGVGGAGGIPAGTSAAAAVLNLTAVWGSQATVLTVYPTASPGVCAGPPTVSNLNVPAFTNQPNRVIAKLDSSGYVCVWNAAGTINIILDANGWFGDGTEGAAGFDFQGLGPTRICDTRISQGTICAGSTMTTNATLHVQAGGVDGLPGAGLAAVAINATAVCGTQPTFFTIYPDGGARAATSDINAAICTNIANFAVVGLPVNGKFDVYNAQGSIDVITDVVGWFQ